MPRPFVNRHYAWATTIMVAFVVYGSLFPFHFHGRDGAGPLAALLTTWAFHSVNFGNLIGNIFLYLPLGLFGTLSMSDRVSGAARLALVVAIGATLCFSMELLQFYDVGRVSTFADIYPNISGTVLGSIAALVLGPDFRWPLPSARRARPVPMLLLAAFLAYRLFPYVPSLDLHEYWQALKPVVRHPHFKAYAIAHYAVIWLMVAALGQALVGAARARWLLAPAILCVLGAKVAITHNSLSAAETVAAPASFLLWLALSPVHAKTRSIVLAVTLAAFVAAERLQPFHFIAGGHAFGWIPFSSFMHGSMAVNTQSFLEKFFLYGGLIWLLTEAGLRRLTAGYVVALGLLATSVLETHLPGRSAEITDAMMALVIAGLFALIDRKVNAPGRPLIHTANATMVQSNAATGRDPDPPVTPQH